MLMLGDDLKNLLDRALGEIGTADTDGLEALRVSLLGKNGSVTMLLKSLGGMDPEARKAAGAGINLLKTQITDAISARRAVLDEAALTARLAAGRVGGSRRPRPELRGAIHPLSR